MKSSSLIAGVAVFAALTCQAWATERAAAQSARPMQARLAAQPTTVDASSETVFTLGPGDLVAITAYERTDLSGQFRVRADGNLSIPLIGTVRANGVSPSELEQVVAAAIVRQTGKVVPVSLEVAEWRAVYTVGDVDKPGVHPFRPGMMVLHALSAAGGLFRPAKSDSSMQINREAARLLEITERLKRSLSEEARLLAEHAGKNEINIPARLAKLVGADEARRLISVEAGILAKERRRLNLSVENKAAEINIIEREIESYKGQSEEIKRRIDLTTQELKRYEDLSQKGLARSSRTLQLRSEIAALTGTAHNVLASIERGNRSLARAKEEKELLVVNRRIELDQEIKRVQNEIREQTGSRSIYLNMLSGLSTIVAAEAADETARVTFEIVRRKDGQLEKVPAEDTSLLRPGDVVRVTAERGTER